jgi:acid phosphatase type 7
MKNYLCIMASLASPLFAVDHGPMVQWFQNPCHEAEIRWVEESTPRANAGYSVGYRKAGDAEYRWQAASKQAFAGTRSQVFAASLEGLMADSLIEFAIRQDVTQAVEGSWKFRTAPEKFRPMHFVIGGDMYHKRLLLGAMNVNCGKQDPLFAALIGDLAYSNDQHPKRFYEWIDSWAKLAVAPDGRLIPMVVCIGNHEVLGHGYVPEKDTPGAGEAKEFYSLFRMAKNEKRPLSSYAIDFGDYMSLQLLDSGHTQSISSQNEFVKKSLAERQQRRFVFSAYHRPAWGSGCKPDAKEIQQAWTPLFEKYGVDAVFEHDHHTYKRTWPLIAGKRDDAHGVPHLGDGAWGVDVRKPTPAELAKRPWVAKQATLNHLIRVDLREDGFTTSAKTADGNTFDEAKYPLRR